MIRRPPRSTQSRSSAASDVYKRQLLGGEIFGVKVPTSPLNFSPRGTILRAFDAGARVVLKFRKLGTWAFKFGEKKIISEKIFFGRKLEEQTGRKFAGKTAGQNFTVLTPFGQGGIETLRLRFGAGSPGKWGSHGPLNLGQILGTIQVPLKNTRGGQGKFFS